MANVQDPEVPLVLIGALNSNGREAVIILKDNVTTSKDTVCICQRIIELDLSIYNLIFNHMSTFCWLYKIFHFDLQLKIFSLHHFVSRLFSNLTKLKGAQGLVLTSQER